MRPHVLKAGVLAEGCQGVGTGSERALGVCWCSELLAPSFKPSPSAWTHVRSSNPDTFATCQCCFFLCPGKRPGWAILFVPTGPMKSDWLGLSALRNGRGLEVSPAVGGDLDSEPGGWGLGGGWGGRQLVVLPASLLAHPHRCFRPSASLHPFAPLPNGGDFGRD